jgi:hypothetical protein
MDNVQNCDSEYAVVILCANSFHISVGVTSRLRTEEQLFNNILSNSISNTDNELR